MRTRRGRALLGVTLAVVLVASACGRDDGDDTAAPADGTDGTAAPDAELSTGPGFDGETITVGAITPTSGIAAAIGNPLTAGNQVYWDSVNADGGIAGQYPVEMNVVDSEYVPATAVQQYNDTYRNVAMYVQVLGTPIVDAILPQIESDGLLAGPATLDAFWVRDPNLMPIGAPYQIQAINALDYAIRELDGENQTICAIVKDDPYGDTGLEGLEYGAEEFGLEIAATATFQEGDEVFTSQIETMVDNECEIVWLTSLPNESIPIITEASDQNFEPTWIGQSPTWVNALGASGLQPYLEENFLLMLEGPQWGDESVDGMSQMISDMEEFAPDQDPDIYFAFGYAQAWAAAQILEEAVNRGDLSQEGIIEASETVGELTFDGLVGDYVYGPATDRDPPRESTIARVNGEVDGFLEAIETNFASDPAEEYQFE